VPYKGADLYPLYALDLTEGAKPLPVMENVLNVLREKDDWQKAFWFSSVNTHLKNKMPKELLKSEPQEVLRAAEIEAAGVRQWIGSADKAPSGKLEATILAWDNGETLWNPREKTLLLSRLIRFDHTEALVSDQRSHRSVLLAMDLVWRIVGRVLWWAGRDETR
jgi:hypothetical protein